MKNNEAFNRFLNFLKTIRMGWLVPFFLLARGENPREQLRAISTGVVIPIIAVLAFLALWSIGSSQIVTKFGTVPGPAQVLSAWGSLKNEKRIEEIKEMEHAHRQREKRLQYLTRYSDALNSMPGGKPEFENFSAVESAVASMSSAFDEANELLDVANRLTILESTNAAQSAVHNFKFESSRELGGTIVRDLVPLEIAYREREQVYNLGPAFNAQPDDTEEQAAAKERLKEKESKELAAEKGKLLIQRQKIATLASKTSMETLEDVPGSTTRVLSRFDAESASVAPELTAYYQEIESREERTGEKNPDKVKIKMLAKTFEDSPYPGKDTYLQQIATSLKTVFFGFFIASAVAIPLGILCGLNRNINNALNPLIQIFKPVSPLAWLPIVMIVVGALYVPDDPMFELSFINSAITVALCSLWPTLVNTAVGVSSVDRDYLNVARVLKLSWFKKIFKVILPASLPLIFTGLRLSLGVGWMVLIAAEMLAQNPGLGKFVWDMFQNGSSETLSMIMVAVFTIGIIGFVLDTIMLSLQQLVSFGDNPV